MDLIDGWIFLLKESKDILEIMKASSVMNMVGWMFGKANVL